MVEGDTMKHSVLLATFGLLLGVVLGGITCSIIQGRLYQQEQERVGRQLTELNARVEQQTAVLHRAMAKYIPVQIPEGTHQHLQRLEEVAANQKAWPGSAGEAENLRQELDQLVKQHLPPWAEEEVLPRLNILRWNVRGLWLLRYLEQTAPEKAEEGAEELRSFATAAPEGVAAGLKQQLEQQRDRLHNLGREHNLARAMQQGREALKDPRTPIVVSVVGQAGALPTLWQPGWVAETMIKTDLSDLLAALAGLDGFDGAATEELRSHLRRALLDQETNAKVSLLRSTLKRLSRLPTDQTRQSGLVKVQDAVASLLLDLHTEPAPRKEKIEAVQDLLGHCDRQLKDLLNQQQRAQEEKWWAYQQWALAQILRFDNGKDGWYYDYTLAWIQGEFRNFKNADNDITTRILFDIFPSTKALLQEILGVDLSEVEKAELTSAKQKAIYEAAWARIGWNKNIDQEIAYRATRDGMVQFLLPINPSLLDPPVALLYNKAFQKGWNKLEGREDQLYVAKQSAVVTKKGLD